MVWSSLGERVGKATVLNIAALVGVLLFAWMAMTGMGAAVLQGDEVLARWKEVFIIVMPTISGIFVAYGISQKPSE